MSMNRTHRQLAYIATRRTAHRASARRDLAELLRRDRRPAAPLLQAQQPRRLLWLLAALAATLAGAAVKLLVGG